MARSGRTRRRGIMIDRTVPPEGPPDRTPPDGESAPYVTEARIRAELESGAAQVTARDVRDLSDRSDDVERRLKRLRGTAMRRAIRDIRLLFGMVRDYARGRYPRIPWNVIAAAGFAVLYFLNPFDLIPDFIPGVGYLDDATLVGFAVASIRAEVRKYARWRRMVTRPESPGSPRSRG